MRNLAPSLEKSWKVRLCFSKPQSAYRFSVLVAKFCFDFDSQLQAERYECVVQSKNRRRRDAVRIFLLLKAKTNILLKRNSLFYVSNGLPRKTSR